MGDGKGSGGGPVADAPASSAVGTPAWYALGCGDLWGKVGTENQPGGAGWTMLTRRRCAPVSVNAARGCAMLGG